MTEKFRVLLLASYFPPDNHVGSWRWERLTEYLSGHMFDVFVVTADNRDSSPISATEYVSESDKKNPKCLRKVTRVRGLYDWSARKRYSARRKNQQQTSGFTVSENTAKTGLVASVRRWLSLVADFPDFSLPAPDSPFFALYCRTNLKSARVFSPLRPCM